MIIFVPNKTKDMKNSKLILKIIVVGFFLISIVSCKKVGGATYPVSKNYGENLFNVPDGKLITGESYSFEADLTKNASLTVDMLNTSAAVTDIYTQKPVWKFDQDAVIVGTYWQPGNYVNGAQRFSTKTVGNNDFKMVFLGTNGSCVIKVYLNGGAAPVLVKNFTW